MRPPAEMPFGETTGERENSESRRFDWDDAEFTRGDRLLQALAHNVDGAREPFVDTFRSARLA